MVTTNARVILWGKQIGAISWLDDREIGVFQYDPEFQRSGIQVAPLMMPLREFPYEFPALAKETFKGLPGLLADSLPDKYGNAIINEWLASQGRTPESFNPVERLCYTGRRGMGALEFEPATIGPSRSNNNVDVNKLIDLSNRILDDRSGIGGALTGIDDTEAIHDILRVGTSAGGARAKAILAWNPENNEFRSGQVDMESGFEQWIMKFDGVSYNQDREMTDPSGYGKIEYTYHLMAVEAGITMSQCRLHHEGGRSHFMTKRFDRTRKGGKIHMQSLCAIAHFDFNQPSSYSYEQAILTMKKIELPQKDLVQQVLRTIFNVVGRNRDDHVKNIAFLMNRRGIWRLSPAFDVIYAWNPSGNWTSRHQMSVNSKREDIERDDLLELARIAGIKKKRANGLIDRVEDAFDHWSELAAFTGVPEKRISEIQGYLLTDL